jgi:hypothetical protein
MNNSIVIFNTLSTIIEEYDFFITSNIDKYNQNGRSYGSRYIRLIDPILFNNISNDNILEEDMIIFTTQLRSEVIRIFKKLSELDLKVEVGIADFSIVTKGRVIYPKPIPITDINLHYFVNKHVVLNMMIHIP